jgi:8-oxo-dGTP diphosphatase
MTAVKFYDKTFIPEAGLIYSVITARFNSRWLFVRHNKRTTWEIAGGHIEENETPDEAAVRELMEETGAIEFGMECVSTYSVEKDGKTGFGRLFFAEIKKLGPIPDLSEISEMKMMDSLPENLTYPDIQPILFNRVQDYLDISDCGIRISDL